MLFTILFTVFVFQFPSGATAGNHFLSKAINVVDVIYAFLTLIMLGIVLWGSFDARELRVLAILTLLCIGFTVAAQVFKILQDDFWGILLSCTFKTMLIMIFFALALSWVEEEVQDKLMPKPEALFLQLSNQISGKKKLVILTLPPTASEEKIWFNGAPYQLLQKFANRRKTEPAAGGWLKLRPKSMEMSSKYDVKDYNEIKRIFLEILSHTQGKDNWSDQDFNFLRKALIEKHPQKDGLYRLRVLPEKINL